MTPRLTPDELRAVSEARTIFKGRASLQPWTRERAEWWESIPVWPAGITALGLTLDPKPPRHGSRCRYCGAKDEPMARYKSDSDSWTLCRPHARRLALHSAPRSKESAA